MATTCVGQAASAAAVMLAAGAPGRRSLLPHTRVLLHQPSAGGQGTIPDLVLQARELLRVRAQMEEVLSRHTGQDVATLRADTDRDKIFTAEQAVAYGLADQVIGSRKAAAGVTHSGRLAAPALALGCPGPRSRECAQSVCTPTEGGEIQPT